MVAIGLGGRLHFRMEGVEPYDGVGYAHQIKGILCLIDSPALTAASCEAQRVFSASGIIAGPVL